MDAELERGGGGYDAERVKNKTAMLRNMTKNKNTPTQEKWKGKKVNIL